MNNISVKDVIYDLETDIYIEWIDHGNGKINYYQRTKLSKLLKFVKKRGLYRIKICFNITENKKYKLQEFNLTEFKNMIGAKDNEKYDKTN